MSCVSDVVYMSPGVCLCTFFCVTEQCESWDQLSIVKRASGSRYTVIQCLGLCYRISVLPASLGAYKVSLPYVDAAKIFLPRFNIAVLKHNNPEWAVIVMQ